MENLTQRPVWNRVMLEKLSLVVGGLIFDWCTDDISLEDCIESSKKVLEFNSNSNGYELAKEFEDEGFSPDSELVDILDSVWYEKHKIQEGFEKQWVSENALKLDYVVGQKVVAELTRLGEVECEIMALYPETMEYGLWHENHSCEKGKGHTIIGCENILKLVS